MHSNKEDLIMAADMVSLHHTDYLFTDGAPAPAAVGDSRLEISKSFHTDTEFDLPPSTFLP